MTQKTIFDFSTPVSEEMDLNDIKLDLNVESKELSIILEKVHKLVLEKPAVPCQKNDTSWLQETKHNMMLYLLKNDIEPNEKIAETTAELYVDLYKTITEHNNHQEEVIKYITEDIEEEENLLAEMKESLHHMQSYTDIDSDDNNPEKLDIAGINSEVSKKFLELKKDLHSVLDTCFPTNNMKELVEQLTTAYFKGGDERYINIKDSDIDTCNLEILQKAHLIVHDPYDRNRIKFDDIA